MSSLVSEATAPQIGRGRKVSFYAAAVLFAALFIGLYGFVIGILQYPVMGWFSAEALGAHQFHDTVSPFLIYVLVGGMLAQLYRPRQRIGAMQQASLLTVVVVTTMIVAGSFEPPMVIFLTLALIVASLHPAREQLFKIRRLDPYLLGLTALAALPLLAYGVGQVMLQRTVTDSHAVFGHYGIMAAYAFATVVLGLVAAFRPRGWRIPAYSVGAMMTIFGVGSLVMAGQASSTSALWGVLAIGWALAFAAVAEWHSQESA